MFFIQSSIKALFRYMGYRITRYPSTGRENDLPPLFMADGLAGGSSLR